MANLDNVDVNRQTGEHEELDPGRPPDKNDPPWLRDMHRQLKYHWWWNDPETMRKFRNAPPSPETQRAQEERMSPFQTNRDIFDAEALELHRRRHGKF